MVAIIIRFTIQHWKEYDFIIKQYMYVIFYSSQISFFKKYNDMEK